MALKKKMTKEDHANLPDHLKSEYIEDGEGYRLDIDGDEDNGALKRAKDREVQLRRDAEAKLKAAQEQLDALGSDDARKKGDIQTLEKSWQKKIDDQKTSYEDRLGKLTSHTKSQLVDNVAMQIASKISSAPAIMLPHIKARLAADFDGDSPVTRVLGADGSLSSMSIDALSAEFVANKDFSAIILASKATGGAGSTSRSPAGSAPDSVKPLNLATMSPKVLSDLITASKTEH
jgi:hypothetical protein